MDPLGNRVLTRTCHVSPAIIVACLGSFRQLFISSRAQHDQRGPGVVGRSEGVQSNQKSARSWLLRDLFATFGRLTSHSSTAKNKSWDVSPDVSHNLSHNGQADNGWDYSQRRAEAHCNSDPEANVLPMDAVHVRKTVNVSLSEGHLRDRSLDQGYGPGYHRQ